MGGLTASNSAGPVDDDVPLCDGVEGAADPEAVRLQSFVEYREGLREDQWVETLLGRLHRFRRSRASFWLMAAFLIVCGFIIGFPLGRLTKCAKASPASSELVVLVSLDGFRADYLRKGLTPNLDRLARNGVSARALVPCFPTKTFPNHYSIATGLYPDVHGIVNNGFVDPSFKGCKKFALSDESHLDPKWWGGMPIWAAAELQGFATAVIDWPGSDVPIGGVRPSFWRPYPGHVPAASVVATALAHATADGSAPWTHGYNARKAPILVAAYIPTVDTAGHSFGPDSAEVNAAVVEVDTAVGVLMGSLPSHAHIVVVSDHGMAAMSWNRTVYLDDYVPTDWLAVTASGPVAFVDPAGEATAEGIFERLVGAHPQMKAYLRADLPSRFHYGSNPRISAVVLLAETGWCIVTRAIAEADPTACSGGNHGYDNLAPEMAAIFVAGGPRFRAGVTVDSLSNLDIYPLLGRLLGIATLQHNGTDAAVQLLR